MVFLSNLRCLLGPDELFFIDVTASTHWAKFAARRSRTVAFQIRVEHGEQDVLLSGKEVIHATRVHPGWFFSLANLGTISPVPQVPGPH